LIKPPKGQPVAEAPEKPFKEGYEPGVQISKRGNSIQPLMGAPVGSEPILPNPTLQTSEQKSELKDTPGSHKGKLLLPPIVSPRGGNLVTPH